MKYIVSLMFGGLLLTSSLTAQNLADNRVRILDLVPVVTSTVEDTITNISTRELDVMENSMSDYSSTIWSRDIYRQVSAEVGGNETFFYPAQSSKTETNLFSLLVNLISTNSVQVYKFTPQPEITKSNRMEAKVAFDEMAIPYTDRGNGNCLVNTSDIPSDKISHYLVKEKWYFDIKTGKGDARVTEICPVLVEKGKSFPLFWVRFDDISVYLARAASSVSVSNVAPALTNVSMFDIIRGRRYRGCIYQVGYRQLSAYFPEMQDLIKERERIENELDYIQSRFYAAESRR